MFEDLNLILILKKNAKNELKTVTENPCGCYRQRNSPRVIGLCQLISDRARKLCLLGNIFFFKFNSTYTNVLLRRPSFCLRGPGAYF